jgi:HNH endonuclease
VTLAQLIDGVLLDENDCWLPSVMRNQDGYSIIRYEGRTVGAHRVTYENFRGEISDPLEIDHLCRVRHCVNPWHMEAVTHKENVRRGKAGYYDRLTCRNGHSFTPVNTYVHPDGSRDCRTCRRDAARRFRDRNPNYHYRYRPPRGMT